MGRKLSSARVAIVTGSAHGIGLSFSRALLDQKIKVAMLDNDAEALESAMARISAPGSQALPLVTDITGEADVDAAIEAVLRRFERIDILVNNAGLIFDLRSPIEEITLADWHRSMDVNVTGTFLMCRASMPHMKKESRGRIVNMSSALAGTGAPGRVHYTTAKAAIIGLTRSLAREGGPYGITVNALAPGLIDSGPRARQFVPDDIFAFEERRRCIPKRMHPEDLISALLFLTSEISNFITGQVLVVDGGASM